MKLNFNTEIVDYDGVAIPTKKDEDGKIEEVMTLGSMAISALNTLTEKDKDLAADKKVSRASLSLQIHDAMKSDGIVDVKLEDIVEMKELMNGIFTPLPIMRAFAILDPKPVEAEKPAADEVKES